MTSRSSRRNAQGAAQHGSERRATVRYHHSESIAVRCPSGSIMTGVSVEISEGGLSAMVNGLLLVGQVAELYPVAGGPVQAKVRHKLGLLYGFQFLEITGEQRRQIQENGKKSYARRRHAR
jgi:c-di-GMP-binding flagellar brake protein YcgR